MTTKAKYGRRFPM